MPPATPEPSAWVGSRAAVARASPSVTSPPTRSAVHVFPSSDGAARRLPPLVRFGVAVGAGVAVGSSAASVGVGSAPSSDESSEAVSPSSSSPQAAPSRANAASIASAASQRRPLRVFALKSFPLVRGTPLVGTQPHSNLVWGQEPVYRPPCRPVELIPDGCPP